MKKLISMILALCLMLAMGAMAEGRPTATAVLDEEAQAVIVTVDLTDGWSVEFAPGAFYLYDGEIREDESIKAIGLTLDKEVYEDYLAEAQKSESCREIENGVCYVEDDGTYYVLSVGTSAYFLLDVIDDADGGDAILERIELVNQDDYFTELAEEPEGEEDEAEAENSDSPVADFEGEWVAGRALLTIEDLGDALRIRRRFSGGRRFRRSVRRRFRNGGLRGFRRAETLCEEFVFRRKKTVDSFKQERRRNCAPGNPFQHVEAFHPHHPLRARF